MNKEGSFTGYMSISGYSLTCQLGFQYFESTSSPGSKGIGMEGGSSSTTITLPKTDYLCANTCSGSRGALFHFEQTSNYGEYTITSRDKDFYEGCYLGITDKSYLFAYRPRSESNRFSFKQNGKVIGLNEMTGNVIAGLELVCKHGGIELHKKIVRPGSNGDSQWAAYVCTQGGDVGLVGTNIELRIKERNVE